MSADLSPVGTLRGTRRGRSGARRRVPAGASSAGPGLTLRRARTRNLWAPVLLFCTDLVAFAGAVVLSSAFGPRLLALLAVLLCLFQTGGLYRVRLSLSVLDDAPAILGRSLAAGAAAMVVAGLDDGVAGIARLKTAAIFGLLALGARALTYTGIRIGRRHHHLEQRALLLGAGAVSGKLADNL